MLLERELVELCGEPCLPPGKRASSRLTEMSPESPAKLASGLQVTPGTERLWYPPTEGRKKGERRGMCRRAQSEREQMSDTPAQMFCIWRGEWPLITGKERPKLYSHQCVLCSVNTYHRFVNKKLTLFTLPRLSHIPTSVFSFSIS